MLVSNDENKGTVRTSWDNVRGRFSKVDPHLTKLIDDVSPGKSFPIYLLYFPYGMLKGDTSNSFLPTQDGGFISMSSPDVDKKIVTDLGYGMFSSPLGVILEKQLEYYIEFSDQVIPFQVDGPGTIFNKGILLKKQKGRIYTPNGILKATAGSRTAFMLPSINSHIGINRLKRNIGADISTPRKSSDHFSLFKAISECSDTKWKLCLAYFSSKWINAITNDSAWEQVKNYILEGKSTKDSFNSNSVFYDIFYSKVQKDRNLRISSPYLTNSAIHLIKIALGEHPGYIPAVNNELLPIDEIQPLISESFQLKKFPTIMVPHSLSYELEKDPVYYSFQNPTTPHFLTKKNERVTANQEIEIMDGILSRFIEEMSKESSMLSGTVFSELHNNVSFSYFHNIPPKNSKQIQNTRRLCEIDPRFVFSTEKKKNYTDFCFEGQFLRGCVQITPTNF